MKYYKNNKPEIGDIVYCITKRINTSYIEVELIEYNMTGLVIIADATIKKKRVSYCLMKINKKYPLVVRKINDNNTVDLSFKYVNSEDKNEFIKYINSYQKSLKIFTYFLKFINKNYNDTLYLDYANNTIWKIDRHKLYNYLIEFYLNKNNLELFTINEDEKELFKNALTKSLGKLEIKSKFIFSIKTIELDGKNIIKNILDNIHKKYNTDIHIQNIPQFYIQIKSNSEKYNNNVINNIHIDLQKLINKNNCIYQKDEIITQTNL